MTKTATAAKTKEAAPKDKLPKGQRSFAALFLAPTVIGLGLFTFVPIIASFLLAFFHWDVITAPKWAGLANFVDLVGDPTVSRSFINTFGFVAIAVILQLSVALGLAILVQGHLPEKLRVVFRSMSCRRA